MTEIPHLLPPASGKAEKALAQAAADGASIPVPNDTLWRAHACPAHLLPWLAWALSVDEWDSAWPEHIKRAVIAASVEVHRRKGTRHSVRQALNAAGYGDAQIIEEAGAERYDGTHLHNAAITRDPGGHWAEYRVRMARPISIEQAERVRDMLMMIAPARAHLVELEYLAATHLYDATITNDGTYAHGVA